MKMYGGVDAYIHIFLTSALVGGEPLNIKKKRKIRNTYTENYDT
jgi:hypothetical protein